MDSEALVSRQGVLMPVHVQVPKNITNQASLVAGAGGESGTLG